MIVNINIDLGDFDVALLLSEIESRTKKYPNSQDDRAIRKFVDEFSKRNLSILEVETLAYAKEHINDLTKEDLEKIVEQKNVVI